jgi:hypothetical protein
MSPSAVSHSEGVKKLTKMSTVVKKKVAKSLQKVDQKLSKKLSKSCQKSCQKVVENSETGRRRRRRRRRFVAPRPGTILSHLVKTQMLVMFVKESQFQSLITRSNYSAPCLCQTFSSLHDLVGHYQLHSIRKV